MDHEDERSGSTVSLHAGQTSQMDLMFLQSKLGGGNLITRVGVHLFWRLTSPALERVVECTSVAIAKKPRNFGKRQVRFSQIALGEIKSQTIQNSGKCYSFGREPAPERSRAHAETLSNFCYSRLPMRKQRGNGIFNAQSPSSGLYVAA